jgi:2-polyprenyl-3-methyl-5-hydroxy-6-metoxy-1,4-benzoquinol methylase
MVTEVVVVTHQHEAHQHGEGTEFDKEYWEGRYRGHSTAHRRQPNAQLVEEAAGLSPGTALDAGCGEGADAIWLAEHGWQVTAVDISEHALRHGREHAESLGADIASRIDWVGADLSAWAPARERFDLVATHYVHVAGSRDALFHRLADAVTPGGTLLIVGHHPQAPQTGVSAAATHEVHFTAEEVAAGLDPDHWDSIVAETRSRTITGHDGRETTLLDSVVRARKHR